MLHSYRTNSLRGNNKKITYSVSYFNFDQRGGKRYKDNVKEQQLFYAKMSSISYGENKQERLDKMKKFGFDKSWNYDDQLSNADTAVLFNPETKEVVVSISGTRIKSYKNRLRDLKSDLGISLGTAKFGYRVSETEDVVKKVIEKYGKDDIVIVGHSLGARVGKIISRDTKIPAVIFNAGSSPMSVISDKVASIFEKDKSRNVTHYSVEGDLISVSERLAGDIKDSYVIKPTDKTKSSQIIIIFQF